MGVDELSANSCPRYSPAILLQAELDHGATETLCHREKLTLILPKSTRGRQQGQANCDGTENIKEALDNLPATVMGIVSE